MSNVSRAGLQNIFLLAMKLYCVLPHIFLPNSPVCTLSWFLWYCHRGLSYATQSLGPPEGSKINEKIILFYFRYHNPYWSTAEEIKCSNISFSTLQQHCIVLCHSKYPWKNISSLFPWLMAGNSSYFVIPLLAYTELVITYCCAYE